MREEIRSTRGRGVAPIGEGVHHDVIHTGVMSGLRQSDEMRAVAVHPAIREESEEVHPFPACVLESRAENIVAGELAVCDRLVNAREVLVNDSPRAEIQVAHLGVAHLAFRQSDIHATGAQTSDRVIAIKLIVKRRLRQKGGVAIGFALLCAARVDSPTVANQKQDRMRHVMNVADRPEGHKPVLALTSSGDGFYIGCVKWRNQLLALFCLLVFFAFGFFYFQYWVIQKPFGIIVFIAEGLDTQTLAEARVFAGDREHALALDSFAYSALLRNGSADSVVPDPAAAATALATGVKVSNGAISMNAAGQALTSLLELAQESGRSTGLITDGKITAPTAAAFYGHAESDDADADFARQLSEATSLDLILGGGASDFLPESQGGRRSDDGDLVSTMREADFLIIQSLAELEEVPRWPRTKVFGLFSEEDLPFAADAVAANGQPTLSDMVRRGIELLQFHRGGYLLVIDASLMRKARRQGRAELRMEEVIEFDRAVTVATEYAGKKSAIIVCGDLADRRPTRLPSPRLEAPVADAAATPFPQEFIARTPELTDLSALTPAPNSGERTAPSNAPSVFPVIDLPMPSIPDQTEVLEDVPAFGMGLGADELHGSQESATVFEIIRNNL